MPAPAPGPAGFKQVIGMFQTAFPDLHITIEDEFGEGNKVGTRGSMTGTHKGEFMGVPLRTSRSRCRISISGAPRMVSSWRTGLRSTGWD
jgi:predicted ester cyclase